MKDIVNIKNTNKIKRIPHATNITLTYAVIKDYIEQHQYNLPLHMFHRQLAKGREQLHK